MLLKHFFIEDVNETNVYLVACPVTRQAALIDAGGFESRVLDIIRRRKLNLSMILLTHKHYDHTDGLDQYTEALPDAEIFCAAENIKQANSCLVRHDHTLELGTLKIRAIHVPGHTPDSIGWHFSRPACNVDGESLMPISVLFSVDILFAGSIGGTHNASEKQNEITGIKQHFFSLPDASGVFPGHGPATTIAIERNANPFLAV